MRILLKLFNNKTIRAAYFGWLAIALFYFYQYILRVSPGVFHEDIRIAYRITAEQFGTLGMLYLLGYSLLQIPLGIIVDRIGVKRMALYSISICIFGSLLFGLTSYFWVAQLSRFIIGVGSASAFMCTLKFIADHFPPGNRGFLMGATLALGSMGSLTASHSISYLGALGVSNWKDVLAISAVVGIFVYVFILLIVKTTHKDPYVELNQNSLKEIFRSLAEIVTSRHVILYSVLAIGLYTPLAALTDLWGPAFLKEKYMLNKSDAANITMNMYIGLTIGSLFLPWLAEKYNKLNHAIIICGFGVLATFAYIVYMPPFDITLLKILLVILGMFCGAEMMCFTGALFFAKRFQSGEVIGVVNTLNMLGGALVQQLIGTRLDQLWDGAMVDSIRFYSVAQFESALGVLTILILTCCIISLLLLTVRLKRG